MSNPDPELYTIFCVLDVDPETPFGVQIPPSKTLDELKRLIASERPDLLKSIVPATLKLYRMDIEATTKLGKLKETMGKLTEEELLSPALSLSTLYPSPPPKDTIHVAVLLPSEGDKHSPSESLAGRKLPRVLLAPSAATMAKVQEKYGQELDHGRPPNPESIPLALLHKVFGEFLKDVQSCTPSAKDNEFTFKLLNKMTHIYEDEPTRAEAFRDTWEEYLTSPLEAATMGASNYNTDGHLRKGKFFLVITEAKKELDHMNTDPLMQAAMYYLQGLQRFDTSNDLFPCLLIYYAGPYIGFAGAIWSTKIQIEVLTPFYPLQGNIHQREIRSQVAKAFAATRRAITTLESYYDDLKVRLQVKRGITTRNSLPYRTYYEVEDQDSERRRVNFTYQERIYEERLMFTAQDTEGNSLFIKFTQQYSVAAHKYCAEQGVAPALYAAEELPGGWFMIVMSYLDHEIYDDLRIPSSDEDSRLQLCAKVKQAMEKLHSGGFVHGDLREVNLKVRKNWKDNTPEQDVGVMLVDFDWAGKEGEACYPANVNRQFYRPKGVEDGALIEQNHDVAMVEHMFKLD